MAFWQWREAEAERQALVRRIEQVDAALEFADRVVADATELDRPLDRAGLLALGARNAARTPDPLARAMSLLTLSGWHLSLNEPATALKLAEDALAAWPAGADAALRQALVCQRAMAIEQQGQPAAARQALEAAVQALSAVHEPDSLSYCLWGLSVVARNANDALSAGASARRALAVLDQAGLQLPRRRALVVGELAYALGLQGQAEAAEKAFDEALRQLQRVGAAEGFSAMTLHNNRGIARLTSGDVRGAMQAFRAGLVLAERQSLRPPSYLLANLAAALRTAGHWQEAQTLYRRSAEQAREDGMPQGEAYAWIGLAEVLREQGEAAGRIHEYLERARRLIPEDAGQAGTPAGSAWALVQAQVLHGQGRSSQAEALLESLVTASMATSVRSFALRLQGEIASLDGRVQEADARFEKALRIASESQTGGRASALVGKVLLSHGRHQMRHGRREEGRATLQRAKAQLAAALGDDSPFVAQASQALMP